MLVASGITAFAAIPDSTTKVIQGCYREIHQVAQNLVTLRLPPGSYVVEGRVVLYASAPFADNFGASIVCRLGETETYFHPVVQKRAPAHGAGSSSN